MNFYVRQDVKQGLLAKHKKPYFPKTIAELERVTGLTVTLAYGCQESATPLVDMKGNLNLDAQGTPIYQKQVRNIQEVGVYADDIAAGFSKVDNAAFDPVAASFICVSYGEIGDEVGGALLANGYTNGNFANPYFMFLRETTGAGRPYADFFDGTNQKLVIISEDAQLKVYGHCAGYFATDALFKLRVSYSGTEASVAKGTWNGVTGGVSHRFFIAFPPAGSNAAISRTRYFFYATGAQLDTFNSSGGFSRLMKRLCWE